MDMHILDYRSSNPFTLASMYKLLGHFLPENAQITQH